MKKFRIFDGYAPHILVGLIFLRIGFSFFSGIGEADDDVVIDFGVAAGRSSDEAAAAAEVGTPAAPSIPTGGGFRQAAGGGGGDSMVLLTVVGVGAAGLAVLLGGAAVYSLLGKSEDEELEDGSSRSIGSHSMR